MHTNGLENFWSLLKRGISGTYVSVEPFHLYRYIDEQMFRYNKRREMDDFDRFQLAASQIVGKRLTLKRSNATGPSIILGLVILNRAYNYHRSDCLLISPNAPRLVLETQFG